MAKAEVWTQEAGQVLSKDGFHTLAASTPDGGLLLLDDAKNIIRIKLTKEEAQGVSAKLAPHIP